MSLLGTLDINEFIKYMAQILFQICMEISSDFERVQPYIIERHSALKKVSFSL